MTTDYRALCVELTEHLALLDEPPHELVCRAQEALAQPEPEVVGPTDAQLVEEAIAVGLAFQPQDEAPEVFLPFDAEDPLDELLVDFARAVLARWGRPAPVPAEGEVVPVPTNADQAALMAILGEKWLSAHAPERLRHPAPVPVAVSERLPGPDDCDAEGKCWRWDNVQGSWYLQRPSEPLIVCPADLKQIWLPFSALPLPSGEVQP